MVSQLVLVRHGDAEPRGSEGDFGRRLTPRGYDQLKAAYPQMFGDVPADGLEMWASPAARAWMTATLVAEVVGLDEDDIQPRDYLYEQNGDEFLDELSECGARTLVVVGHIPFMPNVVWALTGEDVPFHKGAACAIALEEDGRPSGRILWMREP